MQTKLRIANYYENRLGRNDGNPLYVFNAFRNLHVDIESSHMVPTGNITGFGQWDLNMECDWGEDALLTILPYTPCPIPSPSVFWSSDTHLGYEWRLNKAKRTDHNFVCQVRAKEEFERDGIRDVVWMPHAVEPLAYPHIPSIKKYDVCFVGHMNDQNRVDALDKLFGAFPNFFFGKRLFEEAALKYCESRVVFNISIKDDINMRCFEVLATKSLLLTNEIPTLDLLFKDGVHLVTYKTMDEAIEKAKYYIEHEDEAAKIAEAGYQEVLSKHTFKHRCETILRHVGLWDKLKGGINEEAIVSAVEPVSV